MVVVVGDRSAYQFLALFAISFFCGILPLLFLLLQLPVTNFAGHRVVCFGLLLLFSDGPMITFYALPRSFCSWGHGGLSYTIVCSI